MFKNTFENLDDVVLEKKYQKTEKISKVSAFLFISILLFATGYVGYAHAVGNEEPFAIFKSGWVGFLAGIHLILYYRHSKVKEELAKREKL